MSLEEPAEIGDKTQMAVGENTYHAIRDIRHTMRAARSGEHGIKLVSDERDIGNPNDKPAHIRTRLTGRQIVYYRCAEAVGTNFRNARPGNISCVGTNRRHDLIASTLG